VGNSSGHNPLVNLAASIVLAVLIFLVVCVEDKMAYPVTFVCGGCRSAQYSTPKVEKNVYGIVFKFCNNLCWELFKKTEFEEEDGSNENNQS
jgi:hypothetical protein